MNLSSYSKVLITHVSTHSSTGDVACKMLERDSGLTHVTVHAEQVNPFILSLSETFPQMQVRFGSLENLAHCKHHVITPETADAWLTYLTQG